MCVMETETNSKCISDKLKNGEVEIKNVPTKTSFFHINREMWRFKLHFFLFIGGIATVFPYIPNYAKNNIGISTTALAMILMVDQFLFVFTKPIIGYLADYFNKLKLLICTLTTIQGIMFILILLVPRIDPTTTSHDDNPSLPFSCTYANKQQMLTDISNYYETAKVIKQDNQFVNITLEIIRNLLTDKLKFYKLEECLEDKLTVTDRNLVIAEQIYQNKSYEYCKFVTENNFTNCRTCLLAERIHCNCLYTCHFGARACLCTQINTSSSFEQMECVCLKTANYDDILPEMFSNSSHFSLKMSGKSEFATYQFWLFALIYTLGMVCNNAVFTLSDTACCESCEKAGSQQQSFGRQRLWGAIGWGILAPIAGYINDYTQNHTCSWIIMEVCLMTVVWNITQIELTKPEFSKNSFQDVKKVLKSGEFLTFEFGLLMNGIGSAMIWYYEVLFLISIGASKMLCGLSLTIQSFVGSIPFMFFSERIIKKLGHLNVVSLALVFYTVRFLWYSYLYNPWLVLIVEFLHGITYGLLYANIASFGKASAKPGTEATTQSLLFTTHEGLGVGIGCVLGGLGFDNLGGHETFFICALFTSCGVLLHQLCAFFARRRNGTVKIDATSRTSTVIQGPI